MDGATAVDRVYGALRADVLGGVRPAGSRLREEEIAEALGTSRTPTREAIRRLAAEGLAELIPRRGAVVVGWDDDDLDELFDLRVLLEGHAAARAAVSGRADLDRMRELCAAMEAVADPPDHAEITRLNLALHHEIHRSGGGRALRDLVARVVEAPLVRMTFRRYTAERLARSFAQHRDIVAALAAGDPEWARAVMTAHLRAARDVVRDPPGPSCSATADRRP